MTSVKPSRFTQNRYKFSGNQRPPRVGWGFNIAMNLTRFPRHIFVCFFAHNFVRLLPGPSIREAEAMKFLLPPGLMVLACSAIFSAPPKVLPQPDFTKGDKPSEAHDWTLGATGARGWIYTSNGHSRDSRQILVTAVAPDSPAEKQLAVGDVILGVDGKPFAGDARVGLARAIGAAESEAGGGKLKLLR
ncbi:MAG: DUF6288 domain-containing protein, partial [Fimbriiglobus sp.]